MKVNSIKWRCDVCDFDCGEVTNTFGSLLCIYEFLTRKPGADTRMWFKEHSPDYRELISIGGKVIAIWSSQKRTWRIRTDKDEVEDWEEYGNESGDRFIHDEGDAFLLAVQIP